ncbi:MAG: hemolysin family protein [Gemmatimonadales bacterium]
MPESDLSLLDFIWRAGAVFLLVAANGLFVAAEFGLVAARQTRIDRLAHDGDKKAKLAQKAIQSLDRYISGTQLGITIASLGLGWIGEPAVASAIEQLFRNLPPPLDQIATHAAAATIAFLLIIFLHIVLGELAPKAFALQHPEATSRWLAAPLILFTQATNPFIWLLNGAANAILRLVGAKPPSEAERVHQPEEIVMLVKQSKESGQLEDEDVRLIEGVFEFSEKRARDVMTPRTEVVGLPADITIEEASDRVSEAGRSRYPVYRGSLDDIVGIIHVKQILAALRHNKGGTIAELMREPHFLPGTREIEDVLTDMQRLKTQVAVVLDEYGGTAGIVTMEDLIEEIVGEIYDEYDEAESLPDAGTEVITVAGDTEIDDINKKFGLGIETDDYQTIGGLAFGKLGRLPQPGDRVQMDGLVLDVLEMDERRVEKVQIIPVDNLEPGS